MTDLPLAQLGSALIAAAAPWIVVRVALATASAHPANGAPPLGWPPAARRLRLPTGIALGALCLAAFWLPGRPGWLAAGGVAAFLALAGLALRALHEIDLATRDGREVAATTRRASLEPRRVHRYLPWAWRLAAAGVVLAGLAAFLWRLAAPFADRRLLAPATFAAAAAILFWLYEVWIHEVVTGPAVPAAEVDLEAARRRCARRLYAVELTLVTVLLGLAHALLDLDWTAHARWGATAILVAGLFGVAGCALAISSDLGRRRYALASDRR
jgi:hypothetical protein